MKLRCVIASLFASCSEREVSRLRDVAVKKSRQSKIVTAALQISFTPNDRTIRLMQSFHVVIKVKGGRGASSSSPYHAFARSNARLQESARTNPMGKRLYGTQMHATSRSSRWICLFNGHPAFHSRPIHYNVQVCELLSLLRAKFPCRQNCSIYSLVNNLASVRATSSSLWSSSSSGTHST